jgi:hypothetical protein
MRRHDPVETTSTKRAKKGRHEDDEATPRGRKAAAKATKSAPAAKAPAKKAAKKASAAKPAKKVAAKKVAAKPAKKAAAKPAKKAAAKKAAAKPAKKVAAKKVAAKPAKKVAAKNVAAKPAKKVAAKNVAAKPAKKAAAKKAAARPAKKVAAKNVAAEAKPARARGRRAAESQLELPLAAQPPAKEPTTIGELTKAAEAGDAKAAARLGDAYYTGRGVPQDVAAAERFWLRAAHRGELAAKESLANLYAEGEGPVGRDLDRALALLRECSAGGLDVARLVTWLEERIAARDAAEPQPPLPRDEGEAIAALARRAGLERVAERAAALRRSSIRLAEAAGTPAVGASKLGGAPDLPGGFAWPVGPGGIPLAFLAQLDCATLWGEDHEERLPSEGHLWIFVGPALEGSAGAIARRACAVVHDAAPKALARGGEATYVERGITPHAEPTLPPTSAAVRALGLDEDEAEGYAALRDALLPGLWADKGPALARCLGHTDAAPTAAADAAALEEATKGTALVLEVDGRALGEEGRVAVWLADAALAERRFGAAFALAVG